jgi:hypothetical protein
MQAILWNNQGARLLQLGDLENAVLWIHSDAMIIDGVAMSHPKIDKGCDTTEQWKRHDCDGFQIARAETEPAAQLIEPMDPSHAQEHAHCFLHHGQPSDCSVSVYQQPLFLSTTAAESLAKSAAMLADPDTSKVKIHKQKVSSYNCWTDAGPMRFLSAKVPPPPPPVVLAKLVVVEPMTVVLLDPILVLCNRN